MNDQLTQFFWQVAEKGYELRQHGQWCLVEPTGTPRKVYSPLARYTGLFRTFANLRTTHKAILKFANKYGMLGIAQPDTVRDQASFWVEPIERWSGEIRQFRTAVALREMIEESNTRALRSYLTWTGSDEVRVVHPDVRPAVIASRRVRPDLFERLRPGDLITPARHYLQQLVNEHLEGAVSSRLLWDSSYTRLNLYVVPANLLCAIWLQLARAIDGNRMYAQCGECHNYYEVSSPDGARSDKKYCDAACRARAWRKAKEALSK